MSQYLLSTYTVEDGVPGAPSSPEEMQAFISWMINDHFLFLATCEFDLVDKDGQAALRYAVDSGLGLRDLDRRQRSDLDLLAVQLQHDAIFQACFF